MTPSQVCLLRAALKIGAGNPRSKVEKTLSIIGLKMQLGAGIEKWM
jgi:hypothetical protein